MDGFLLIRRVHHLLDTRAHHTSKLSVGGWLNGEKTGEIQAAREQSPEWRVSADLSQQMMILVK